MIWQFWALFFVAFVLGAALAVAFCWLGQLRDANLRADPPTQALTGTALQAAGPNSALQTTAATPQGAAPDPQTASTAPTATRSVDLKDVHPSLIPSTTAQLATIPGGGTLLADSTHQAAVVTGDQGTQPDAPASDSANENADLVTKALAERDQASSLAQTFELELNNLRVVHSALANAHDKLTARFEKVEHQRRYAVLDRNRMQERITQLENELAERLSTPLASVSEQPSSLETTPDPRPIDDAALADLQARLTSVSTTNEQLTDRLVHLEAMVESTQRERDAAADQIQAYQDTIRELETSVQDARMALDSAISDWSLRFDQLQAQHDTDAAELERLLLSRKELDQQIDAARQQADQAQQRAEGLALATEQAQTQLADLQQAFEQAQQELSDKRAAMDALQQHCVHLESERTRMLSVFGQFAAASRPFVDPSALGAPPPNA